MYKQFLAIILIISVSPLAHPAHVSPDTTAHRAVVIEVPERTQRIMLRSELGRTMTEAEWKKLAVALGQVKGLKVGMTRAELLKDFFPLDNEIFNDCQRRFVLKSYPDLLVDIRFSRGAGVHGIPADNPTFQMADHSGYPTDVVTKISLYYTGPATEKQHTVVF